MDKKKAARFEMLKKMSKDKSKELHEPVLGEKLKAKKFQKVTVVAPSKVGLEKGLSKAQQILKAKLGKDLMSEEDDEDEVEQECPACEGEGCKECEEDEEELLA